MRLLDKSNLLISLEHMGFSEETLARWRSVIRKPEGIILITGPTGSGKTSTLYAVLNEINSPEKNIVTVENPVEYRFPMINQVQTNEKTGLTFATGLRSILRQDPDIIMIGEIRDLETAEIAIRSSLTGHLVLSTLHTNDAPGAISRLIDMGVEPFLVASSLIAVLAQRLVRKICPNCKVPYPASDGVLGPQGATLYRGQGCRECKKSGYRGRTGIFELMLLDDDLRRLILRRGSSEELRELARKKGMMLLREDGLRKAREGVTTIEEVMRVA